MNNKKFLIALLSVLILVFNSCNKDSTNPTNSKVSFRVGDLVGTWHSTTGNTFTIIGDGSIQCDFRGNLYSLSSPVKTITDTIANWNGNQEILEGGYYDMTCRSVPSPYMSRYKLYFKFSSSKNCIVTLINYQEEFTKQ